MRWLLTAMVTTLGATTAQARDIPLYQPAPDWVIEAQQPAPAGTGTNNGPTLLIFDNQQRVEDGRLWTYSDTATKVSSAEMLGQMANITLPWAPDKGDLIIHELKILRPGEEIDLLKSGKTFTVLRREEGLEQRQIDGILTATVAVEGLRIGDILRLRYSTTMKDDALAGRVQSVAPMLSAPMRIGFGRLRAQWPSNSATSWKALGSGAETKLARHGGYTELTVTLPLPKQPEMPDDAPGRFRQPPLMEISTFSGWTDVSKVMALLYHTDGLIADGSPLAQELETIRKTSDDPVERAQLALRLVQDHVRYLAVGMNGGNYIPQSPEKTWALRYGDCKAKTLLLLALLRGSGIEAEPVLASTQMGGLVSSRLPSAAAFDHVLVRAVINGESLWLDGTGSGARIEDIRDTPPFYTVLPLRDAGADPIPLTMHRNARANIDVFIDANESTSVDLPSVFDVTLVMRGPIAAMFGLMTGQLDQKQQDEMIRGALMRLTGEAQFSEVSFATEPQSGTATFKGHGVTGSSWRNDDRRMKRSIARALSDISFSPDRAKAAWQAIPVATPVPFGAHYSLRIHLPEGGRGYTVEGEQNSTEKLAGYELTRTTTIAGDILSVDERIDSTGSEIPASQIPAERDRLATAQARAPRIVAPVSPRRRWDIAGRDPDGGTQIKAAEAVFAAAIANDPDEIGGYSRRASLRAGVGDRKGAISDLDKAIAIAPDQSLYLRRSQARLAIGDIAGALEDAEAGRDLDPSSFEANVQVTELRAERGDLAGAVALLDQRIALGGESRDAYRQQKASLIGIYGKPEEALGLVDTLLGEKPAMSNLLNLRCWIKGTRSVMLDTALKDCTSAAELSQVPFAALDSRAVVWFRMGKYDEALRDLNAVLEQAPGLAASRFMRGVVLEHLHRSGEAAADLAIARRISPRVDANYARFGIKP